MTQARYLHIKDAQVATAAKIIARPAKKKKERTRMETDTKSKNVRRRERERETTTNIRRTANQDAEADHGLRMLGGFRASQL